MFGTIFIVLQLCSNKETQFPMDKVDALSHKEVYTVGIENVNKGLVVISLEQICANERIEIHGAKEKILEWIKILKTRNQP